MREAHLRRANGDGQDGGLVEYDTGGGGGGGTPEQQAFNFASSIVDFMELDPFNPDHVKWREMVTSTLERIYMLAHTDPGKFINGPFQNDLTAQQLYDMVSSKRFSVQLSGLAFGVGANYDLANKISYDIDHSDLVGYRNIWGDRGMNYVILHEIAHIDTRGHQGNVEGNANTLALGIAEALGISFLTAGELSTVGGGVVSQN